MIAGLFIMYWGFGIFRGETSRPVDRSTPGFGGGEAGGNFWSSGEEGGGGSGSF